MTGTISSFIAAAALFGAAVDHDSVTASRNFFEDDRIRVLVPTGWRASQVTATATGDRTFQLRIGGVLSKGHYRIYLLTHYNQASGIEGGRFGEISEYVQPWVNVGSPWGCFNSLANIETPVTKNISRVDLFLDTRFADRQSDPECRSLHSRVPAPVWFGSYFGQLDPQLGSPGFFLNYPGRKKAGEQTDEQMAFTATLDTADPETLPAQGDRELTEFLSEASIIVKSIQYK